MEHADTRQNSATILTVGNAPGFLRETGSRLEAHGYRIESAPDIFKALEMAEGTSINLAVVDSGADGEFGVSLMEKLREIQRDVPVVIVTASGNIGNAVDAMKRGACTYLAKPFEEGELIRQIESCLGKSRSARGERPPRGQPEYPAIFERIIARSCEMKAVLAKVAQVAITDSNVYIEGESGTGKELIARCLHEASPRKDGPFVAINCAAIPENLFESELLGYEKGAFTSADGRRDGLFTRAHGGSFFFDELSELPLSMQVKLLRILEEREFYPLGSNRKVKVDVRIIAASNRNLEKLMKDGLFREDLFYRIHVIPIVLPSLRKRKEDILPLARHFLAGFSKTTGKEVKDISPAAVRKLMSADWPGNVRELENAMEYAVAMATGEVVTPDLIAGPKSEQGALPPLRDARDTFEKDYLVQLLDLNRGNVSQAAKVAGKHRADFYALLRKHRLEPMDFREKNRRAA